jgi:malate dehydrogenase (oxaloacetate-decarboxylating)
MAVTDTTEHGATSDGAAKGATRGRPLLRDPRLNHGTAFTHEERAALGLEGLLPAGVSSLEQQAARSYEQYGAQPTPLAKNEFLAALRDRNEVLYYKLLGDHLKEMLPVIYDPVVAQAIERYSHEYQRPDGVYLSIDDIDGVEAALRSFGLGADDVDLLVATDAEAHPVRVDAGGRGIHAELPDRDREPVHTPIPDPEPGCRHRPGVVVERPVVCREPSQPRAW